MKFSRQTTLKTRVTLTGVGVHSGAPVTLILGPAGIDAGFVFIRTVDGTEREVKAVASAVTATAYATVLGDREGALVSTAEHVLAALRGMGVDNATVEVDGPEIPIMDGSAAPFVAAIDRAGIVQQAAPRRFLEVLKPIQVRIGESLGELRPYAAGFRAEIEIDFAHPLIGRQAFNLDLTPETFRRDICRARTFGYMKDVASLWSAGYARGASFANSVVFDDDRLLNSEGLRYADECARHKALDVIGDLTLAGLPLLGLYRSVKGGHKLNHAVLTALLADRHAWRVVEAEPARRSRTAAEVVGGMLGGGIVAPAYAPDVT
ncbi:MAG: UDP-3-O-acyl-N-acetylglucosamine deacetylase [Afipia sp.]|nr:UDP-3-O-acyl-N-acetylglucosamine deacetylase [Afipia sp.]OJW64523.1 MAG: UDP-3-O-[3-hydroxymyristoyl] N-acetylglucosamine deacetylase [Afipia sp. 64-13]